MKELEYLNEQQREAVLEEEHCIVNANVGSGKTTVLIAKVQYLHEIKHIPLEDMMVLTFTNKTADEIKDRLKLTEPMAHIGTFHGVALGYLKHELPIENIGFQESFQVIDPDEELEIALQLIQEHSLQIKYKNRLKKRLETLQNIIIQEKRVSKYQDDICILADLLKEKKRLENKMTYFDLLYYASTLLETIEKKPKWIIVDEVQDCNEWQITMIQRSMGPDTKLFFVGDPNQVIYSWRGSDASIFYRIKHQFQMKELSLPINYRSSHAILEAAKYFQQSGNTLQGVGKAGNPIQIKRYYDGFQEAHDLAIKIKEMQNRGILLHEIGILYRLQEQAKSLQDVFSREGIPYKVNMKQKVQDIPVLFWLQHLLRVLSNENDTTSAVVMLTDKVYGERVSNNKAKKMIDAFRQHETVPSGLLQSILQIQMEWQVPVDARSFYQIFDFDQYLHPTVETYQADQQYVMSYLNNMFLFMKQYDVWKEDIKKKTFCEKLEEFLNVDLLDGMNPDDQDTLQQEEQVQLMTLHASKGLEFRYVYIIGVNNGYIPLHAANYELEEEERRLFFVGMTRAKEELCLSYYTNPGSPRVLPGESKFLKMIPPQLLFREDRNKDGKSEISDVDKLRSLKKQVQDAILSKNISKEEVDHQIMIKKVKHKKYGIGTVLKEDDTMITVAFEEYGEKEFIKMFADLEEL